jgi:hypothetical protein
LSRSITRVASSIIPVRPRELLQNGAVRAPVIDRAQAAAVEQVRERVSVDLIAFVALPRRPASIADDDPIDERRLHVVEPLRLSAVLEGPRARRRACPNKLGDGRAVGRQYAPSDHASALLPHRGDRSCWVDVQGDILG